MVRVIVAPGDSEPQSIGANAAVQALSEYKPKDDEAGVEVMIDPDEFTLVLTKTAPYTVNIKTKPAKITEITVNKESFLFAIFYTHFHQCAV